MRKKDSLLYDAFMLYDLNGNRIRKTGERFGADGKMQEQARYSNDGTMSTANSTVYSSVINTVNDAVVDGEEMYCCNERNELTEKKTLSAITEYLYDENGSLVSEKEGSRTASYQYDLLNRQTHIKTSEGREQENFYDGEGLRAGISENGKASTLIFHNGEILAECDGDSRPVKRHLQGIRLSCVQTLDNDAYHAYHQDEQGSTAYITGNDGTAENSYFYDAFGSVLESRETIVNRILYAGQQYDQEAGQYYLRARYYNPVIGRFTQEDTYRGDGLNLYAYCANNPVMYYDPSGHDGIGDCPPPNQTEHDQKNVADEADISFKEDDRVHTYYTVQNEADVERLRGDGTPWPTDGTRANLGDGVYAWGNIDDANQYLERKQGRTSEPLSILQFDVNDSDLNQMNILDTRNMTDDELNDFFSQYGRLYGGDPNHGFDYIINNTNLGTEHFFNKTVFDKLNFK